MHFGWWWWGGGREGGVCLHFWLCAHTLLLLLLLPPLVSQHQGLPPLLKLLNSHSSSVQYNAAFTLYELSDSPQQASLLHQAGGLQHLYVCSHRLQVRGV